MHIIKGEWVRMQVKLGFLFASLETELCRQTQEETNEVENKTGGLEIWGPHVLFTYKLTYKSPVLPQSPIWNMMVDELMQQLLIYYFLTRCLVLFNALRTERYLHWQSSHYSGGARWETSKWLDKIYSAVTHVRKQANMALAMCEKGRSRIEEGHSRKFVQGTLKSRRCRWEGPNNIKSQRKNVPGRRNRKWKGTLSRQTFCIVEVIALTRGLVHVPCDF